MKKFYAIGVGPGNSSMVTKAAIEKMSELDVLFIPKTGMSNRSRALEIADEYLKSDIEIVELLFPMNSDKEGWEQKWEQSAEVIREYKDTDKVLGFITIGDIMIYSTFAYLIDYIKTDFDIEVISGIPSFCAAAAAIGKSISQGHQSFCVLTEVNDSNELEFALDHFETVILMKIKPFWNILMDVVEKRNLDKELYWVTNASYEEEEVINGKVDKKVGYFTVLIIYGEKK